MLLIIVIDLKVVIIFSFLIKFILVKTSTRKLKKIKNLFANTEKTCLTWNRSLK